MLSRYHSQAFSTVCTRVYPVAPTFTLASSWETWSWLRIDLAETLYCNSSTRDSACCSLTSDILHCSKLCLCFVLVCSIASLAFLSKALSLILSAWSSFILVCYLDSCSINCVSSVNCLSSELPYDSTELFSMSSSSRLNVQFNLLWSAAATGDPLPSNGCVSY